MGGAEWFFAWVILSVIVGKVARNRGRSAATWFLLSLLISPLLALIAVASTAPRTAPPDPMSRIDPGPAPVTGPRKTCPDCGGRVAEIARICRFCRHEFPGRVAPSGAILRV
jgi:hypothetical protein